MRPELSRRRFMAVAGASAMTTLTGGTLGCARRETVSSSALAPADTIAGPGSLKAHAAAKGIFYGCAIDTDRLSRDPGYAGLVVEQAAVVASPTAMQWAALHPGPERYAFAKADALVAFAEVHNLQVHGQLLCAPEPMPAWLTASASPANARQLLIDHVAKVAGRYAGRMHSWAVVNGAVAAEDGRPDGLRDSPWLKLIGADYIEAAFRAAREADPRALLAYSESALLGKDRESQEKRIATLVLLRRLKTRRVPIDALGVAAPLKAGQRFGPGLLTFLAGVRELGLQVFVEDLALDGNLAEPNQAAHFLGNFLDFVLREFAVDLVMTRGLEESSVPSGKPGMPFDAGAKPTPAFFALRGSFDRCRPR